MAYIIRNADKLMEVPIFSEDWTGSGSWFPLFVPVAQTGQWAGEFPTIEAVKKQIRRQLSAFSNEQDELHLWAVKMPKRGDPMPDQPETFGDEELPDWWSVNDESALFMIMNWGGGGSAPAACNMRGIAEVNEEGQGGQEETQGQGGHEERQGQAGHEERQGQAGHEEKPGEGHTVSPLSECSIKEWASQRGSSGHREPRSMMLRDVEGLDIDDIYRMGFSAGMMKAKNATFNELEAQKHNPLSKMGVQQRTLGETDAQDQQQRTLGETDAQKQQRQDTTLGSASSGASWEKLATTPSA